MDSIVIGTAGHIDHGKTTLVQALTGTNTDTTTEEKARGITIGLGFAYFTLPSGKTAGIVDVPGHERFIRNMLMGASGIDIVMLVIAANEGIMPQTREHIDILSYLNIQQSVVVLTKIDMVDDELKEMVREETTDYLSTTFLKDAPLLEVNALTGEGVPALIETLDRLGGETKQKRLGRSPRLSVDRTFSINGFGTVVTGTLSEGTLSVGDEVTIYPEGVESKIRGLQVHEQPVESSFAGQRTAINLAKVSVGQIPKGSVIAPKGAVTVTQIVDVSFSLLKTAPALKRGQKVNVYIGATEVVAMVLPFEKDIVEGGEKVYGQLLLDKPVSVRRKDPFIMRLISPVETMGGGHIVDPQAHRYRKKDQRSVRLVKKKDDPLEENMVSAFVESYPFSSKSDLIFLIQEEVSTVLAGLVEKEVLIKAGETYAHKEEIARLEEKLTKILKKYHEDYSLREGLPKAELLSAKPSLASPYVIGHLLDYLEGEGIVSQSKDAVSLASFATHLTGAQEEIKAEMMAQVAEAGYSFLTLSDLTGKDGKKQAVAEILMKSDFIVLEGRHIIRKQDYEKAKDVVRHLAKDKGSIKMADVRDALSTSRKYALFLLERFDKERFTKRDGEDRILL